MQKGIFRIKTLGTISKHFSPFLSGGHEFFSFSASGESPPHHQESTNSARKEMCHLGRGILRRDGQKGLLSIRSVTIFGGAPFEKEGATWVPPVALDPSYSIKTKKEKKKGAAGGMPQGMSGNARSRKSLVPSLLAGGCAG